MTVSEVLTALGSWEIDLLPTIPREDLDRLAYFGHVAIVHGRVDPRAYGDNLLSIARYVGVVRTSSLADDARTKIPNDNVKIGGVGMAFWLGDEDNKGAVIENATTFASGSTFPNVIRGLLPSSGAVTEGTLYPVAGTYGGTHQWQSPREAIQYVCQTMSTPSVPVSWRVSNTATLDAGPESNLFTTTPQCAVVARGAGEDMSLRAIPGSMDLSGDVEDYTTRVVLLAEGSGTSTVTGSADISPGLNVYKDLHGNPLKLTRLVSESDTVTANAAARAQIALGEWAAPKRDLRLSIQDYDVDGTFSLGDYVWAYDPDKGLVDTANEITFRGQRLNPIKLQVTELSWGVTAEYTVAYRAADGTWIDLTDHIQTSDAGTYVTVGGFSRQLTGSGSEPVGSRPNADRSVPGVPVLVTPFQGAAYLDNRGFTRSRVIVSWVAPSNVDGSTILDGDHYEVRYAVDTDSIYPATWAQVSQIRWADMQTWAQPFAAPSGAWHTVYAAWGGSTAQLQDLSPGVGYDVQIRAVDSSGNAGAWSGTTTFTATSDNLPPSTPAAPSVAGSRIALQITHALGKATGGTYNLESDLHHLEVHVEYEPTFTPSAATLKGKVSATAGMIQAQIPVVSTVQVEETSARYVRVVAVDITGNKSGPSDAASATALLIDDAHISDLTVTKVTAGTIVADWIVGARIKTADTGTRVELNSAGLQAYNAAGTQTVNVSATTGDVAIVGQLKSGTIGKRLEVNPTSTFLPEIRFYPNAGTDYGYINSISAGSDASVGVNSSPYDDGTGTLVGSRVYLSTVSAELAVVRSDTQARRGGYVWAYPDNFFAGYNRGGVDGGTFNADANGATVRMGAIGTGAALEMTATFARLSATSGGANIMVQDNSVLYSEAHIANFVSSNAQELFWCYNVTLGVTAGPLVYTWGATQATNTELSPICQVREATNSVFARVSALSTTGFTVALNAALTSGGGLTVMAVRIK